MSILVPPAQSGVNAVDLWKTALAQADAAGETEIRFSPGCYHFHPEGCPQRYCYFSNNDEGIKTIALDLQNRKNLRLIGDHTEFFFHGRISPIVAVNCENFSMRGFTIDFEDSFVSDADVISHEDGVCWIKVSGKHRFEQGRLHFTEDFYDNLSGTLQFYFYDTEKEEILWNASPMTISNRGLAERKGLIGIPVQPNQLFSDALIIKHELRLCPGMVFDRCCGIDLKDISIYHAAGMGILAQLCSDISLAGIRIVPRGRRVSVSDDAVHFSDCRGRLLLENSILSGTLDDSFNSHGIYRPLKMRVPGGKFYYLDTGHFQQQGIPGAFTGDTLELIKNDTQRPYARIKLKEVRLLNKAMTKIVPEGEMPEEWVPGDDARVLETGFAELTVRNCTFHPLNGRGVLASGLKKVVITGNRFHTSGAAVFVSGDGNFWYESGPVEEMLIADNFFNNCCYRKNSSTRETVAIFPELQKLEEHFYYHGKIELKNNLFRSNIRPQVSMLSVKEPVLSGNAFEKDETYPFDPPASAAYSFAEKDSPWAIFRHCGTVIQEQNSGFETI